MGSETFLPLYFGDFLSSTAEWENDERGAYLLLLGHQWTLGSLPDDEQKLSKMCSKHVRTFRKMWVRISQKFVKRADGRLINPRLEEHRERHMSLIERKKSGGKLGAQRRWGTLTTDSTTIGSPIGSPISTPYDTNQTKPKKEEETPPTPLAGGIDSDTDSGDKKRAVAKKVKPLADLPDYPPELNRQAWAQWTNYRSQIRKPIRHASLQAAMKSMCAIGDEVAQQIAVDHSIANGWQGLFARDSRVVSGRKSFDEIRRSLVGDDE